MATSEGADPCIRCRHALDAAPRCACPAVPENRRAEAWWFAGMLSACEHREPVAPAEPLEKQS